MKKKSSVQDDIDRLQTMMATIEQQSLALSERQIASQQVFLGKAEAAYAGLASSVGRSLKESAAESARANLSRRFN